MRIKEIRISAEGYEVTLAWTMEEIETSSGTRLKYLLEPNVHLLQLIEATLKLMEKK
jgi:hypothetical protein